MFKAKENFNSDGVSNSKLEPAVYVGTVARVEAGTKQDFTTKENVDTIDIYFKDGISNNEHLDQSVDVSDEDKASNMFERLCHIASRVTNESDFAKFVKSEFKDFASLSKAYIILMKDSAKTQVEFKVAGSSYNGKPSTKIPSFSSKYQVPFIEKVGSGKQVKFTNAEITENNAYKKLLSGESDTASAGLSPVPGSSLF